MISKFPIEISDREGIADAVNYLLSGPAGLGQNFDGFSDYNPLIIRPTFARPFTLPVDTTLDASWYIRLPATAAAPTPSNPTQYITIDFGAGPGYTNPPFQFGDRLRLTGFTPSFWDDTYYVFSSTTTSVTLYTSGTYTWPPVTVLGDIVRDYINFPVSTDCLAQVVVDSTTQRIFITAQVEFSYTVLSETIPPLPAYYSNSNWDLVVQVNRYAIGINENGNQVFSFQETVSQKIISDNIGSPTAGEAQAIFTTVIDQQLNFGSYAYILEIAFVTAPTLGDGSTPGLGGYGTSLGWLFDMGFQTAPLPAGVTAGNVQYQSTPGGTTYTGVVPTVLTGSGFQPLLDVTVWPNALIPEYAVGDHLNGYSTVEVTLNTTNASYNTSFVPGDVIKILGTDIGGASPLNDLYLTVTETDLRSTSVPGKFTMGLRNLTTQVIKE